MNTYQTGYSEINPSLFDDRARIIKSRKIYKIIEDFSKIDLKACRCLEVGCATGMNTLYLADFLGECSGVDIDDKAVAYGFLHNKANVHFIIGDAMQLPCGDNIFDIVVCNHVYEHVPDSHSLMEEVYRVLKPGGFCYFAAGNKFSVIEGHYKLPFLSWLPKPVANKYLQIFRRGTIYYENHLSYFQLKQLVKKFIVTDYTLKIVKNPQRFGAEDMIRPDSPLCKIPLFLLRGSLPLIPTYIFILTKPHEKEREPHESND
jgi:ubiquinone/menaquinone biosynthesis C-methylase UbiE